MLAGEIRPTKKPDIDSVVRLSLTASTTWHNTMITQIVDCRAGILLRESQSRSDDYKFVEEE